MTSHYDDSILRSLRRITRAIDLYSKKLAANHQLTGPQLVCLRVLAQIDQMSPSELSKQISLSQATVTGILDRLERRELLTRQRSSIDKRRVHIKLTPAGQKLVNSAPTPLHQRFAQQLAELPKDKQFTIDQVLAQVVEMMEAEELDAAPMLAAGPVGVEPTEVVDFLDPETEQS